MTELSLPWDGTSTGDAGTYTDDEWRDVFRALAQSGGFVGSANVGIVGAMLNSLKPSSPGNDQIRGDTGYAVVDGTVYYNSAAVTITPSTPGVGTTGRMLVLTKEWASVQTIRLKVISSSDGTATIPSVTQTSGTKWEIPICSFTHATDGTIAAVTDLREFTNSTAIEFQLDGGGAAITTGEKGHYRAPRPLHIYGWEVLADQSGAIKVDIWKDTYANFPPTNADSIAGNDEPEITASGVKAQNLDVVTGGQWTLEIAKGDILAYNVDSVTTIQRALIVLLVAG